MKINLSLSTTSITVVGFLGTMSEGKWLEKAQNCTDLVTTATYLKQFIIIFKCPPKNGYSKFSHKHVLPPIVIARNYMRYAYRYKYFEYLFNNILFCAPYELLLLNRR